MSFTCLLFCTLSWTILPPYIPCDTELHIHPYCKFFLYVIPTQVLYVQYVSVFLFDCSH